MPSPKSDEPNPASGVDSTPTSSTPRKATTDAAEPDPKRNSSTLIVGLAMQLPFTIFAGYLLGSWLDSYFETTYLRLVLMMLAIVGAFTQLIQAVLKASHEDETKD